MDSRGSGPPHSRVPVREERAPAWARGGRAAHRTKPHGHLEAVNGPPAQAAHLPLAAAARLTRRSPSSKSMLDAAGLTVSALSCGRQRAPATRRSPQDRPARPTAALLAGKPQATARLGAGPVGAASRRRAAFDWQTRGEGRALAWGREASPLSGSGVLTRWSGRTEGEKRARNAGVGCSGRAPGGRPCLSLARAMVSYRNTFLLHKLIKSRGDLWLFCRLEMTEKKKIYEMVAVKTPK